MDDIFSIIDDEKFRFNGSEYRVIVPSNIEELADALKTLTALRGAYMVTLEEDHEACTALGTIQRGFVDDYINDVGNYNNQYFNSNLQFLMKKYGISMKALEELLHISAGYISRAAGEDAKRKLSIDIVWKIAKLFEVDLNSFISTDLQTPSEDNALVVRFLDKLKSQTMTKEIKWHNEGGGSEHLSEAIRDTGMFDDRGGVILYANKHLYDRTQYVLMDNVVSCEEIDPSKRFYVINYKEVTDTRTFYDFLFAYHDHVTQEIETETVFSTYGLKIPEIEEAAGSLYKEVKKQGMSIEISSSTRELMSKYLKQNHSQEVSD